MKIAVLSDIHSNIDALTAVLNDSKDCDYYINLGDVVGYNYDPNGCVNKLVELRDSGKLIISIGGNHDYAVLTGNYDGFNTDHGKKALDITRKIMGRKYIKKLGNLFFSIKLGEELNNSGIKFYHALLKVQDGKRKYVNIYPNNALDIIPCINKSKAVLCGHSHLQFSEVVQNVLIHNPGSVGQPRNCNELAQYSVIDITNNDISNVELRCVEYDISKVANENRKLGLDIFLSQRLYLGI